MEKFLKFKLNNISMNCFMLYEMLLGGGNWNDSSQCRSQCRNANSNDVRSNANSNDRVQGRILIGYITLIESYKAECETMSTRL
ncbi:MAG: hypothetical protein LBH46_00210 [Rickettsiales bacterium]|jgi:hypothetical protein|nr:hypothetical protein [Rickettsiales bacterium]